MNKSTKSSINTTTSSNRVSIIKKLNIDKDIKFILIWVDRLLNHGHALPTFGYTKDEALIFSNFVYADVGRRQLYTAQWIVVDADIMVDYVVMLILKLRSVIVATYTVAELTRQLCKHEATNPKNPIFSLSKGVLVRKLR